MNRTDGITPHSSYLCAYVTDEEYRKIISGVLQNLPLDQIDGIEHILEETRQLVTEMDLYINRDGSDRTTPLQKPRNISDIRFSLPEQEIRKLRRIKDPLEALNRPEEHMRVYRSDGSWVDFTSGFGTVKRDRQQETERTPRNGSKRLSEPSLSNVIAAEETSKANQGNKIRPFFDKLRVPYVKITENKSRPKSNAGNYNCHAKRDDSVLVPLFQSTGKMPAYVRY